ncbi:MAG TPA: YdcF family protein [Candidatus Limnocylindrales bacterium]|nr:YdcF family protein [Candidatus Limnocylindrales bacterium]
MPRSLIGRITSIVVRGALVAGLAVALAGGFAVLRIWQQGAADEERPADAIVVLGAAQYDGRPSPVFEARLQHAVALYRAGVAPRFVVTGGKQAGDRTTEAAVARQYAIAHGIPASAIFGEDRAHNTLDSLRAVAGELDQRGLRSAVFVSDPTHMYRVLRIASDLGLEAYGSPTRTSPVDADLERRLRATAHELGALALYFATGGTAPEELPGG